MTADQIVSLGTELAGFLDQFTDCFGRSEPRGKLQTYILGQLGQLPRKSIEPIALAANVKPRTLQEFLASDAWDEDRMTALVQQLVARDHADPQAIAVIDESGHPKKGCETAGVSRQYCGNTGKIDNCVMTVHLTYTSFDGKFRTMLDSSLYLPKCWDEDRERCRKAKIPDELVYRPKYNIALEQLDRSAANEVRFAWVTADEWYSQKPAFVQGLEQRGLRFVLEIPKNFAMWLHDPHGPKGTPAKPVENLCRYSRAMMCQPWQRYYIKDTDKGPMVWEVKCVPCWLPRSVGPYWLVMARNALSSGRSQILYEQCGGRCSAGNDLACGLRALAGGALSARRKKRTGTVPFRGAVLSGVETPFVDHASQPFIPGPSNGATEGGKIRRSHCRKSTWPRTP